MNIRWRGDFGANGYGTAARSYVLALKSEGYDVTPDPLSPLMRDDELTPLVKNKKLFGTTVFHQIPIVEKHAFYYAPFEFYTVPSAWYFHLYPAKCIMVPSHFAKECYGDRFADRVHVVNHIVDTERFYPEEVEHILPVFTFLAVFEWVERKVPEILIRAFAEEFGNENVALLLKISCREPWYPHRKIKAWANGANVSIITERFSSLKTMYNSVDCVVDVSAGEGWGLVASEAMSCGRPVIASRYGGGLEFMNDDNSYLVDCGPLEEIGYIRQRLIWCEPQMKWRKPLISSLRTEMRKVYENRDVRRKTSNAIRDMKQYNNKNAVRQIEQAMDL